LNSIHGPGPFSKDSIQMPFIRSLITATIALGAAQLAQAQIVNIDATYGFSFDNGGSDPAPVPGQHLNLIGTPVQLTLGPGDYRITNAWGLPGASYGAYRYNNTTFDWGWAFVVVDDATRNTLFYKDAGYTTNSAAAVIAQPAVQNFSYDFSLSAKTTLDFTLRDYYVNDNAGGISLKLAQIGVVPEPMPGAMLLAGLGVVGYCARRRHRG
jgi:hypothetical protein